MAIIPINDTWRITSDEHAWAVERCRGVKKDNSSGEYVPNWVAVTWHATLAGATKELAQRMVRLSDAEGIPALLAELERINVLVTHALEAFEATPPVAARRGHPRSRPRAPRGVTVRACRSVSGTASVTPAGVVAVPS